MSNELPWSERINAISVNPDMANRDDVAKMAAQLSEAKAEVEALQQQIKDKWVSVEERIRQEMDIE
jgi:hypothetical protein